MTDEFSAEDLAAKQRWDAYFWEPGSCLKNKLGLKNPIDLNVAEYRLRAVRQGEIDRGEVDIPRTYDKAHLQAIHRHMFQDVYDWAGKFRDVGISKRGHAFVPPEYLDKWTRKVGAKVAEKDWSTMSREEFVQSIAEVYSYQNLTHPFREGNGATGKVFISHVSEMSPYRLDFDRVEKDEWNAASSATYPADLEKSVDPDPSKMYAVFDKLTVERGTVLRADAELAAALQLQNSTYAGIDKSARIDIDDKRPGTHAVGLEAEARAERQT